MRLHKIAIFTLLTCIYTMAASQNPTNTYTGTMRWHAKEVATEHGIDGGDLENKTAIIEKLADDYKITLKDISIVLNDENTDDITKHKTITLGDFILEGVVIEENGTITPQEFTLEVNVTLAQPGNETASMPMELILKVNGYLKGNSFTLNTKTEVQGMARVKIDFSGTNSAPNAPGIPNKISTTSEEKTNVFSIRGAVIIDDFSGLVQVYSLKGEKLKEIHAEKKTKIDLQAGTYVIRTGTKSNLVIIQ